MRTWLAAHMRNWLEALESDAARSDATGEESPSGTVGAPQRPAPALAWQPPAEEPSEFVGAEPFLAQASADASADVSLPEEVDAPANPEEAAQPAEMAASMELRGSSDAVARAGDAEEVLSAPPAEEKVEARPEPAVRRPLLSAPVFYSTPQRMSIEQARAMLPPQLRAGNEFHRTLEPVPWQAQFGVAQTPVQASPGAGAWRTPQVAPTPRALQGWPTQSSYNQFP